MGMIRTLRAVVRIRRRERDRVARRLRSAANVDDLRSIARRRLPAGVFDYIDGGAEDEADDGTGQRRHTLQPHLDEDGVATPKQSRQQGYAGGLKAETVVADPDRDDQSIKRA